MTQAVNAELAARMPWIAAEEESIWEITGSYLDGGTFRECLAMVLPFGPTDGATLFVMIHPNLQEDIKSPYRLIGPSQISRATRLVLVKADDGRAYFGDEQDLIDIAHERAQEKK